MSFTWVILSIWIGLTLATVLVVIVVVVWALRNRQFEDQDRARYLPLGIPLRKQRTRQAKDEAEDGVEKGEGHA